MILQGGDQDLSSFTSSSSAVDPWLRQLVASNHVGAPSRTISLSNHSPHGHIAPKVPTTITTDTTTIATTTPPCCKAHYIDEEAPQGWLAGGLVSKALLSFLGRIMQSTFNLSMARALCGQICPPLPD